MYPAVQSPKAEMHLEEIFPPQRVIIGRPGRDRMSPLPLRPFENSRTEGL